ncbi:hypothetical protein [Nonomuraea typhae]|uniref:hypothetical protein n=1 Tax=Nonomuraea typhae TaxID=2603600 RepID=UPI0012F8F6FB|nr:hypothetical protein [Nonomuraea typhae]
MTRRAGGLAAALSISVLLAACQQESPPVNTAPLPSVVAGPYLCDLIPADAVRLMTGVQDPLVRGDFDPTTTEEWGSGGCFIYSPIGNKPKVLDVTLSPAGSKEEVEDQIRTGATRLPDIVPGGVGFYFQGRSPGTARAAAMLVRGYDRLIIELERGVKGRDNAADVVALMRLIAPKLITAATPAPKKKG